MPININSSLPRTVFRGVKDETIANLSLPTEQLPIRLPLFMDLAPWGEELASRYIDNSALELLYGADTINPKSKFFTHQSQFLKQQLTAGGKAIFLRLVPGDATQASFRLALDMVADKIPVYERNADGSYKRDANGALIDTGTPIDGYRLQWRFVAVPSTGTVAPDAPFQVNGRTSEFGAGVAADGLLVSVDSGAVSTLTPIMDGLARFRGAKGNDIGLRLIAPTVNSSEPADPDLQESLGTFLYRLQIVNRANSSSSPLPKRTISGQYSVDFSLKPDALDLSTGIQYYAGKVIKSSYESTDWSSFTGFGPFEKLHVYDANIATILQTLATAESAQTGVTVDPNQINFLTGVDVNGIPYHSFVVEGPAAGGLLFSESSNYFMSGGSDGTVTKENYNALVANVLNGLADAPVPFNSIARMPYDSVWDTGFPVETKKLFANFHSLRPDCYVHACTQDILKPLNTPAEDSSIMVMLRSHFRSMQESSEFGTKALRFAVFGNAGYLINDDYDGLVPFLEQVCIFGAKYMGAENGEMNSSYVFGRGEQNIITRYRDHNAGSNNTIEAKALDWQNGMNFADWYDMSRLFWPGLQSIYEDHTSILHSYMNTQIACNLTRIGHQVWRECSGDDKLTDDEFLQLVEDKVTERTTGKYDERVDITPNAYYTALDGQLKFSYHLDIQMAGDNIRTTENLAIIAQDRRTMEAA